MKLKILIVLFGLSFSLLASASEPLKSINPQNNIPKYGKDSATCVQNLSLYREFYKQWKQSKYTNAAISDASRWWSWVFQNCPRATENIYIDGVKMLKYRIRKANDPDVKNKLIDTLMMVYDQRIKYFPLSFKTHKPQEGAILGRKGVSLYEFKPEDYKEVNEILKKSIDLDKEKALGPAYVYYFRTLTKMASKGEVDTVAVVDAYDQLSDYIEANLKKYRELGNDKKLEQYENVMGTIEKNFEPFAQCHDLVRIYQQKFDHAPDDVDLMKKIVKILDKKKCVDEPLYFNVVVSLYKKEPSPEAAYMIGKMMLNQKRYKDAIPYMENATKMENKDKVDDALIFLAQAYRALGNYPMARQKALEAAKLNPKWGEPYAFIGDLYVLSVDQCGSNDLEKKAPYWAAVDMYKKAKAVDPEMTEKMNELIRRYSPYFPPAEVLFFYNLQEGDDYKIGCWINVTTKVRAAK